MATVYLGNHAVVEQGSTIEGEQVTQHVVSDRDTLSEHMRTLTHADGVWPQIATAPPVWVASDNAELAEAIGAHFDCSVIDIEDGAAHFNVAHELHLGGQSE